VEDGDVQALGRNGGKTTVGIAKDQHRIGLRSQHELVAAVDNVANGGAKVVAYGIHIYLRIGKLQIPEEYAIQIVIVVLSRMGKQGIEIDPAFVDHSCQTDDLGTGAYNDQQLELAVVAEMDIGIIEFY